jgi:HEAT repeat protein
LLRCAREGDVSVRRGAIAAVAEVAACCPEERPAVARALLALLDDPDAEIQKALGEALPRLKLQDLKDLVLPPLAKVMENPEHPLCYTLAMLVLEEGGSASLPHLARLLQGPRTGARGTVLVMLHRMGQKGPEAEPLWRRALEDDDTEVRKSAHYYLHGERELSWLPPLLRERVECEPGAWRVHTLRTLASLGPAGREALPTLLRLTRQADGEVRLAALEAVVSVAPGAADTLPALTALLEDKAVEVRRRAVEGLAALGPAALPALQRALDDDEDGDVRQRALAGLAEQPRLPAELLSSLLRRLTYSDAGVRASAARALSRLGDGGAPAVPALKAALCDDDAGVRASAARALGALGPPARAAEAELKVVRRDREEVVRRAAAEALARFAAAEK